MTKPEMIETVRRAVLLKLGTLRSVPWRKGTTLETLVRMQGADEFAKDVAEHLILSNKVLFQGPPQPHHSAGGGPPTGGE